MRPFRPIGGAAEELASFSHTVAELNRQGKPVLVYPGCGDTPAAGFLNLDIKLHEQLSADDPRWDDREIFIFPFADTPWPIPDNSVDYIFHEDFFEHISQKQQICFLAECLRVMKPGKWHRINTPCLANSMRAHSDFSRGMSGVYTDEWDQHGHVALVTRTTIEEMALLVGYRYVAFNLKGQGLSPFKYPEGRPGPDRDQLLGNIFADLLKSPSVEPGISNVHEPSTTHARVESSVEAAFSGNRSGRDQLIPLRWSAQKVQAVDDVTRENRIAGRNLETALAEAQLAAATGNLSKAESIASSLFERNEEARQHGEVFIDFMTTLFIVQRFDLATRLLQQRYDFACPVGLEISREGPGSSLVAWSSSLPERMSFSFDVTMLESDSTREQMLWFLWLCPLFAHFSHSAPNAKGSVIINQSDCGIVPGLAMCDSRPDFFLIPDNTFIPSRGYEHVRRYYREHDIAWEDRKPIAFWRGSTTGLVGDPNSGWRSLPRLHLCQIARQRPDIFDAGITNVVQISDPAASDEIRAAGMLRGYVPVVDFNKYRYQIDIDGNTNSWPGLFQKLLTGSPVLKVASPHGFKQWYYDRLAPWGNFVPVESTMADLVEKVEWLRSHDDSARRIGQAGRELAESLDYEGELARGCRTIEAALTHFTKEQR